MQEVSVVIPCHNAGAWLEKAVASALGQSHPVAKVVVVDDGSTDGSARGLSLSDARLRVIHLPQSKGACHARNVGWNECREEWMQFLDADDELLPDKIAVQLREGEPLNEVDVLYSPVLEQQWQPDGSSPQAAVAQSFAPDHDLLTRWLRWEVGQTGALLWRRAGLERIGGWKEDQPCCQDNEITLRAMMHELRFRFTPNSGAIYRHWSQQTLSRRDPVKVIRERTALMDLALDAFFDQTSPPELEYAACGAFAGMARTLAAHNLAAAASYCDERKRKRWWRLCGPAAPLSYRIIAGLFGFSNAERLAKLLRR